MRSYVEAFFRHKYLLCLPIILGFVVGSGLALQAQPKYVATASFWVDTPVPEASTVGTTGGQSPPSAGAAALLSQMLATRTFMRSAIEKSPLAEKFDGLNEKGSVGKVTADEMLGPVASSVVVAASGPQVVSVTVTRKDAKEAAGLANAILEQFGQARSDLEVERAQAEVSYAQRILDAAESADGGTPRRAQDERLSDAQTAYEQAAVRLETASTTKLQLIDHPDVAIPQSRRKTIAFGALGGLMAGSTIALMALILIVARDRSMRNEQDATAALGLEVVGSIPKEKWKGSSRPKHSPARRSTAGSSKPPAPGRTPAPSAGARRDATTASKRRTPTSSRREAPSPGTAAGPTASRTSGTASGRRVRPSNPAGPKSTVQGEGDLAEREQSNAGSRPVEVETHLPDGDPSHDLAPNEATRSTRSSR